LSIARRTLKDKLLTPTVPLTAVLQNRQVFLPDPVLHLSLNSKKNNVLWGGIWYYLQAQENHANGGFFRRGYSR
jgi:hypothetical protein